jgi:hypothetical protein
MSFAADKSTPVMIRRVRRTQDHAEQPGVVDIAAPPLRNRKSSRRCAGWPT